MTTITDDELRALADDLKGEDDKTYIYRKLVGLRERMQAITETTPATADATTGEGVEGVNEE